MLHRIVQVYVVLSAILLLAWIGHTALFNASDDNPRAVYCDYHVTGQPGAGGERLPEANWAALGGPCRLRIGAIVAEFGPIYLNFLVRFQWPAYMYLIIRHFLRLGQRAREAGTDPGTWLRGKWRALVKPVLFRIVRVYLFISAILLLTVIGVVAGNAVSFNLDGLYCDHEVAGQVLRPRGPIQDMGMVRKRYPSLRRRGKAGVRSSAGDRSVRSRYVLAPSLCQPNILVGRCHRCPAVVRIGDHVGRDCRLLRRHGGQPHHADEA